MMRTTYQRPSLGQTVRFRVNWWRVAAILALCAIAAGYVWVALMILSDPKTGVSINVEPGERVCVEMLDNNEQPIPDAYYCGPLVATAHDSLRED